MKKIKTAIRLLCRPRQFFSAIWDKFRLGYRGVLKYKYQIRRHEKAILKGECSLVSFDVFDTVVVRQSGLPESIFMEVQECIKKSNETFSSKFKNHFVQIRQDAEAAARSESGHEDIRFDEIYTWMSKKYRLSKKLNSKLMQWELQAEKASIQPHPYIVNLIKKLREKKQRIIFVSDMYLSKDFIKELLIKAGAYQKGDGLYVSSEHRVFKCTGKLYEIVLEKEQCRAQDIYHIGDNFYSDVLMSRKCRIKGVYLSQAFFKRYEKLWLKGESKRKVSKLIFQRMAGASRLARLNMGHHKPVKEVLYHIGAQVAGPIIYSYVLWILTKAKRSRIKRLYFLARDGQILFEIAKIIKEQRGIEIELKYLYVSRQAWFLPAVTEINEKSLNRWALYNLPYLTLRIVARRLSLNPQWLLTQFKERFNTIADVDDRLSEQQIEEVACLFKTQVVSKEILKRSAQLRKKAFAYFSQEGLCDEISWAIVDIGWQGNLQYALKTILEYEMGCKKIVKGFYLGLTDENEANYTPSNRYYAYLLKPKEWKKANDLILHNIFDHLEIFTSADHSMTYSYKGSNGSIKPLFKGGRSNPAFKAWGIKDFRAGIKEFVKHLNFDDVKFEEIEEKDYNSKLLSLLRLYMVDSHRQEAIAIGDHPHVVDQAETYVSQFAPKMSFLKAFSYCYSYRRNAYTRCVQFTSRRSCLFSQLILKKKSRDFIYSIRILVYKKLRAFSRLLRPQKSYPIDTKSVEAIV